MLLTTHSAHNHPVRRTRRRKSDAHRERLDAELHERGHDRARVGGGPARPVQAAGGL